MNIRVLIVDDQILTRLGLHAVLERARDIEIIGEAASAAEALSVARAQAPDVVLMDIKMSGGDGIDATRMLRQHCPKTQVLILSVYGDPGLFRRAAAAGAAGYVLKDISPANLAAAIRAVHAGQTMISPVIARQLLNDMAGAGSAAESARRGPYGLTEREIEVLAEVSQGLSDKEIAAKLFLSESTIKSHLRAVYRRLRLRNRAQAAAFAIGRNLVDVHPVVDSEGTTTTAGDGARAERFTPPAEGVTGGVSRG